MTEDEKVTGIDLSTFYRVFEDTFRGSKEDICQRLKFYSPIFTYLNLRDGPKQCIDLGCGRGEWVSLASNEVENSTIFAIDFNIKMSQDTLNMKNVKTVISGALEYLKSLESNSIDLITSFHMVEHITNNELHQLVKESYRVLNTHGLLLLETPNPENFRVATETFYFDQTHIKPIPSALLKFMVDYYGFTRSNILRLNSILSSSDEIISDYKILMSVSADYSIIAQKNNDDIQAINDLFNSHHGASIESAVEKINERHLKRIDTISNLKKKQKEIDEKINFIKSSFVFKVLKWLKKKT